MAPIRFSAIIVLDFGGELMGNNLGKLQMRTRPRLQNGLHEFDCLPKCLREWITNAVLPWRPLSVKKLYNRALSTTGDPYSALIELDRIQENQLAKYRQIKL